MKILIKYEDEQHVVTMDLNHLAELIELTPEQIEAAKRAALEAVSKS